jgi:hypothetical protein
MHQLATTATAVDAYIQANLFDPVGLMYSGIDSHTDKPFAREFITRPKVPLRAAFDPWSYWTYEDSVMTMGLYLDGLMLQHAVTGDEECLQRAHRLWTVIERNYSASQVYGPGSFLRPYGGFLTMGQFMEPLGTDQASPLFCGLYRYLAHLDGDHAEDVRRVMLNTLKWYEQQGFRYLYYKAFIHGSMRSTCHSNSYFLPAIAWAATVDPDDPRWGCHLDLRLGLYADGSAKLHPAGGHPTFNWGSDLGILREILGSRFDDVFTPALLDEAWAALSDSLDEYEQPGFVKRMCPESADPDFEPSVDPGFDPEDVVRHLGHAYYATRHHGRTLPPHQPYVLLALASIGHQPQDMLSRAAELLGLRSRVPQDFTDWIADDYDRLPETVHIYARSVGWCMVGWWRNYWLLRSLTEAAGSGA